MRGQHGRGRPCRRGTAGRGAFDGAACRRHRSETQRAGSRIHTHHRILPHSPGSSRDAQRRHVADPRGTRAPPISASFRRLGMRSRGSNAPRVHRKRAACAVDPQRQPGPITPAQTRATDAPPASTRPFEITVARAVCLQRLGTLPPARLGSRTLSERNTQLMRSFAGWDRRGDHITPAHAAPSPRPTDLVCTPLPAFARSTTPRCSPPSPSLLRAAQRRSLSLVVAPSPRERPPRSPRLHLLGKPDVGAGRAGEPRELLGLPSRPVNAPDDRKLVALLREPVVGRGEDGRVCGEWRDGGEDPGNALAGTRGASVPVESAHQEVPSRSGVPSMRAFSVSEEGTLSGVSTARW